MKINTNLVRDINNLKKYEGKDIKLEYVWYGIKMIEEKAHLEKVVTKDFYRIEYTGHSTPFIGYGTAIQKITHGDKVLYFNPLIRDNYDLRNSEAYNYIQQLAFDAPNIPRVHCHCGMHTVNPTFCERCGCKREGIIITFNPKDCISATQVKKWKMMDA